MAMELTDYNIAFFHIKGHNNILADAISRHKMLDIYRNPIEYPKKLNASKTQHITEIDKHKQNTHLRWYCTLF